MTFKQKIETSYPLPMPASIWDPANALAVLDDMIELCIEELEADLEVYETIPVTGLRTHMPENCKAVTSVKLDIQFQGNRFVKKTYDRHTKILNCRYFPATVTYKRTVTQADFDNPDSPLKGPRLTYAKEFIIERMLQKEISYLTAIKLDSDSGQIDVDSLERVRLKLEENLKEMKADIMLYTNG